MFGCIFLAALPPSERESLQGRYLRHLLMFYKYAMLLQITTLKFLRICQKNIKFVAGSRKKSRKSSHRFYPEFSFRAWNFFIIALFTSLNICNWIFFSESLNGILNKEYIFVPAAVVVGATLVLRASFQNVPPFGIRLLLLLVGAYLNIRYFWWRATETLIFDFYNGPLSIGVFCMELVAIVNMTLVAYQTIYPTNRTPEAYQGAERIQQGYYAPNVDILIPTLNEPISILKRTLVGCMTINYPHKQIWLLDDGKRPEVKKLARELHCNYLSRDKREHYKAGNLNFGIQATEGDIIVIFDADFIPLNHFLERTLGFFEDPNVALVVTPQNFYNPDPPEINLGGRILPHEQAVFYNIIQPGRDRTNSIVCTGTSIILRRSSLEEIGGFPTGTIVEDWIAGMLLQGRGYKTVYLNELLSIGSAPESLSAYLVQRIRWAEGTLKVLFSRYNPLLIPGLNIVQRINHFSGILFWIEQGVLSIAYIAPLCFLFLGMRPLDTTIPDIILYWMPNYLFATIGISWVVGARTIFVSFVYNALQTFAVIKVLIEVFFMPKIPIYFDVTPKGVLRQESYIDINLTKPIIILMVLNWMALLLNIFRVQDFSTAYTINLLWTEFNAIILWISLMAAIDGVDERKTPRVVCAPLCKITISKGQNYPKRDDQEHFSFISRIFDVSESGASFRNSKNFDFQIDDLIKIEFLGDFIEVQALVKRGGMNVGCQFLPMNCTEELQIMEFVYCRREHWPQPKVADEIRSLKALVKSLFIVYPLQRRK